MGANFVVSMGPRSSIGSPTNMKVKCITRKFPFQKSFKIQTVRICHEMLAYVTDVQSKNKRTPKLGVPLKKKKLSSVQLRGEAKKMRLYQSKRINSGYNF